MLDRTSIIYSALFHMGFFLLMFVGLPHKNPTSFIPRALPVKVVPIGKLTQSPPSQKKPKAVQKKKIAPPPATPKQAMPSKLNLKVPEKESLKKKTAAPKMDKDFNDVLKAVETDTGKDKPHVKESFDTDLISDKLSVSELDALRQQIQGCWLLPPGVLSEKDLLIEVGVDLDTMGRIQKINVLTKPPPQKQIIFRVAVDSIRQALKAPECTPLRVPGDKYHMWKHCVLRFSPQGIG